MITCTCPASASLSEICKVDCPQNFGQIQKIAFQRIWDGDKKNSFPIDGENGIKHKTSWDAKFAALDETKITISPFINAPTSDGGAPRTFGGGNETLGGIEEIIGSEPVTFSAQLRRIPQEVIKQLKSYMCEAQAGNLGVYLINENGQIEGITDDDFLYPIPVHSFFVGDKIHGGLEAPDSNAISWSFAPNYSDDLAIITPNFNALDLMSGCQ